MIQLRTLFMALGVLFFLCPQTSQAMILDLSSGGNGFIDSAYFTTVDIQSTGSGVIDPFVRISANTDVEQGYNTSGRPLQFDENSSPTFTHDLLLSAVSIVTINGVDYREFLLDINQTNNDPLLSLDQIQLYLGSSGGLNPSDPSALGTLVYNLDASGDNWIKLNYSLNSGSGSGDLFAYIPNSVFTGPNQYAYFYSIFGQNENSNDGYEEWAVRTPAPSSPPVVPEPASLLLLSSGLAAAFIRRKIA